MKTDSVNFTDDLVNGYCEESGTDDVMMRRMYDHYSKELTKKVGTRPEVIEAPIRHLGTFFMPLHGAIIITNKKKGFLETFGDEQRNQDAAEFYEKRKQYIKGRIEKCKSCGIKNIRFLHTLISKNYIKND